jgi:hypothetical protein
MQKIHRNFSKKGDFWGNPAFCAFKLLFWAVGGRLEKGIFKGLNACLL